MSDLLNITTPVAPKNYDFSPKNNPQQTQTDRVFNLGDTTKVQKSTERDQEYTYQDNKDGSVLNTDITPAKDPTAGINVLRSIIGEETLTALRESGSADVLNKVTEFANEVMLKPANVSGDMIAQEKQSTAFSDPIWGNMKDMLMKTGSSDVGEAVLQFTKAAADASARDSIVTSVAENLRYLSDTAAPTRSLAQRLTELADGLTKDNFTEMKGEMLSLLNELRGSLLMNDKTENLISLAIYNISRFNGSTSALGESFNAILDMTPNQEQADALRQLFMNYIENADLPTDIKLASLNTIVQGSASPFSSLSLLAEKVGAALNESTVPLELLTKNAENIASDGGLDSLRQLFSQMLPASMSGALNNILKSYDSTGNVASLIDRLSIMINSVDDMDKKTMLADKTNEILANLPFLEKDVSFASDSILNQQSLILLSQKLGTNLNEALAAVTPQRLSAMLSTIETQSGSASIRSVFGEILPQSAMNELNLILRSFNATGDLNKLIDNLSIALNSVNDMDKKIILAQSINQMLSGLTAADGIKYKPPTSMENLMDFLSKNINDSSLKSLSSMSRSDMMQGFLSTPGAMTPLLHFLVPINDGGFKAFGELWVDPDAESRTAGEDSRQMFLCFEIEDVGYFELELRSYGKKLNVSLLCPSGTEGVFKPLRDSIPKIASASGYSMENTTIGTVIKRRDLTQVFPKIKEKRSGLNVKI